MHMGIFKEPNKVYFKKKKKKSFYNVLELLLLPESVVLSC